MFINIVGTVISVIKSPVRVRIDSRRKTVGRSQGHTWYLIFAWESPDFHGLALFFAVLPPFLYPSFFLLPFFLLPFYFFPFLYSSYFPSRLYSCTGNTVPSPLLAGTYWKWGHTAHSKHPLPRYLLTVLQLSKRTAELVLKVRFIERLAVSNITSETSDCSQMKLWFFWDSQIYEDYVY